MGLAPITSTSCCLFKVLHWKFLSLADARASQVVTSTKRRKLWRHRKEFICDFFRRARTAKRIWSKFQASRIKSIFYHSNVSTVLKISGHASKISSKCRVRWRRALSFLGFCQNIIKLFKQSAPSHSVDQKLNLNECSGTQKSTKYYFELNKNWLFASSALAVWRPRLFGRTSPSTTYTTTTDLLPWIVM